VTRPGRTAGALALAASFALASCVGSPPPGGGSAGIGRIARPGPADADFASLLSSDPARAFTIAFAAVREGSEKADEAREALGAAASELVRTFDARNSGGDPLAALAAYDSLEAISSIPETAALVPAGWKGGSTRSDLVEAVAAKAESDGKAGAARAFRAAFPGAAPHADGGAAAARKTGDFSAMVGGVCTILVNRGIKVERNVGVPDRVIGSGFFIDGEGYLLTNYHVIESEVDPSYEGYSRLYVRLAGEKYDRIPAKVVGWDRALDLALLKAPVKPAFTFEIGSGRDFKVGDRIYAIGSPVGLESTVTSGIVSAVNREILSLGDAIQVDAPLTPGNSGGPLIDEDGRLAGIVFAGAPQFQGLAFALPMRWVRSALPSLYSGGETRHPFIGACVSDDGPAIRVDYAIPGSAAEEAGIAAGETLVSVNGKSFANAAELRAYSMSLPMGSLARVETESGGTRIVRIADMRPRPYVPLESRMGKSVDPDLLPPLFGMYVERTGRGPYSRSFRIVSVRKGGIADEAGLSPDDPIVLHDWKYAAKTRYLFLQLWVKRQKQGFLETIIQLPAAVFGPVVF